MTRTLISILLIICCSCSENHAPKEKRAETATTDSSTLSATNTIKSLYTWYSDHQYLQQAMVNNAGGDLLDSTKFYSVNFDATNDYLNELKKTGLVSDKYLSEWRNYFVKCEEHFKKFPAYDGPPAGFEYDFITKSQDFELTPDAIKNAKVRDTKDHGNTKTLTMEFPNGNILTFTVSKSGSRWLIDKIE